MSDRARPSNHVEATEQAQAEKTGGDRQDLRVLPDATDPAALKTATFSAPGSATSGLQGYNLEGAGGQYSKTEAGYTDGPDKQEPCIHCAMFRRPNRCTLVRGDISARGHCKHFSAKAAKVAKVAIDAPICAGVAFTSPAGRVLFLQRGPDGDHAGEWCLPGGHVEPGETLEQAAARECIEEIGFLPAGDREPCAHVIVDGDVDFTTFRQPVDAEFEPKLNAEHTDFVWAAFNEAPQPIHPWVKAAMPLIESGATVAKAAKRTLYVHRPLTNVEDFTAWAKSQGFDTVLTDPHVTIAWSKDKLDWSAAGDTFDTINVPAAADQKNGKRSVIPLGDKGAVVLRFESTDLQERWQQFRDAGASWDHEHFKPHVTITFDGADVDLTKVEPWTGALEFGPEVFAPINDKWADTITEKLAKHTGHAPAEEDTTTMDHLKLFVPIKKVDAVQRMVYGTAADEAPDHTSEIFDYVTSKPLFQAWSAGFEKVTDGKSLGNVRAMHGKVAAGKVTEIGFDDKRLAIDVATKIVDDAEWRKVEEGVYTGFSIGGSYVKKWKDGEHTRYTANPSEISLVDLPCIPTAMFSFVKADGTEELRKFKSTETPAVIAATAEQIAAKATELAKSAGDPSKWVDHIEAARAELAKVNPQADAANVPKGGKKLPKHDGKQGHMADEGDTETKIGDGGHEVAASETNPKAVPNDKDKIPPKVSDKEKEAGAESNVSHKAAGIDDGDWEQKWVHPRLPGQTFGKKAELRQALVDLEAQEGARAQAAPVLDVLKGLTAELDKREGKDSPMPLLEALKSATPQQDDVLRKAAGVDKKQWEAAGEFVDANPDHVAVKALAAASIIVKDGAMTVTKDTLAVIKAVVEASLVKRDFTQAERNAAAKSGAAMKDGSFPITSKDDLKNAVEAHGRAKNKAAAKRHIIRRAKALDATDQLPDDWKAKKVAGDGDLMKGVSFYGISNLLQLLASLEYAEEAAEVDEYWGGAINVSKELKDRFGQAIVEVGDIAAELLDAVIQAMREEESREAMERAAPILDLMKVGARHSATDKKTIKKVHDAVVDLDKDCCPAGDGEADKAVSIDGLQKQLEAKDTAFNKTLGDIGALLKDVADRVRRIEDTPMPSGPQVYRAVDKGHQLVEAADSVVEQPGVMEKLADAAIRASHRSGYRVGG